MTHETRTLPAFERPPLVETVFSLQFDPLKALTTPHIGLLWKRFDEFPKVEEHSPLAPAKERFEPGLPPQVEVLIEEKPPLRRVWFLNKSKSELIQLQADRFIHNWRKREESEFYPRFSKIRESFRKEVEKLELFLSEYDLGRLQVNQCELTYLNHIEPAGVWTDHADFHAILKSWALWSVDTFLPHPEDVKVHLRFVMRDKENNPVGRLHVTVQPAWRKSDNTPLVILNMTARGYPLGKGVDGAFSFFDLAHEWIVRGFSEITTPEIQKTWGPVNV